MRVPITLDLHVPNFNFPGVEPAGLFEKLTEIAQTAERSGFSSISLMDHLHQIEMAGPPENYMFEGATMLAALAARTETLTLGLLVGSVTYRNPALAAKITTGIDIISGGRVWHGLGGGWFEAEHNAYGFEFPPLKERLERLGEALQVARAMFTDPVASFSGKYFKIDRAFNNPRPLRGDIPILVGGSGEKVTLKLVARYADGCNLFGGPEGVRRLLGVLERHCEDIGRDPSEITKTGMGRVLITEKHEDAIKQLDQMGVPEGMRSMFIAGDPDSCAEQAQAWIDAGAEGITVVMPGAHDLEQLELAGRTLGPIFAGTAAR